MKKEEFLQKINALSSVEIGRIIVFRRGDGWREVTKIQTGRNYTFLPTCEIGGNVTPMTGDAVFSPCSQEQDEVRTDWRPFTGQAAHRFAAVC